MCYRPRKRRVQVENTVNAWEANNWYDNEWGSNRLIELAALIAIDARVLA